MPLWMVPDQHITNDHLFSSWNTERPFKMKAHRMCTKVIADNYVKSFMLINFLSKNYAYLPYTPLYNNSKLKER